MFFLVFLFIFFYSSLKTFVLLFFLTLLSMLHSISLPYSQKRMYIVVKIESAFTMVFFFFLSFTNEYPFFFSQICEKFQGNIVNRRTGERFNMKRRKGSKHWQIVICIVFKTHNLVSFAKEQSEQNIHERQKYMKPAKIH